MSSSFDALQKIFRERFEPKSGDDWEKQLFLTVLSCMHSANHGVGDKVSKDLDVSNAVWDLEKYLEGGWEKIKEEKDA